MGKQSKYSIMFAATCVLICPLLFCLCQGLSLQERHLVLFHNAAIIIIVLILITIL